MEDEIDALRARWAVLDRQRAASDAELRAVLHEGVDLVPSEKLYEFFKYVSRFFD